MFGYQKIENDVDGRTHYRVHDSNDDRIATCYVEDNAKLVVRLLNLGAEAAKNDAAVR